MKNKKKKIILAVIISILIIMAFIIKIYNKPHINVTKTLAKFNVTSQKLTDDFLTDEDNANKKYVNQIIQVSGTIAEVDQRIILIKDVNSDSDIQCNFKKSIMDNDLKNGQKIIVKGLCTGYLLDVVLIDCVLVKK
ncbi:MAG TPA: hypothetical protein ENK67_07010 [Flavobacteriia bacterium]|nr:hypothetical protein [Flavobacteriia bacterium]